MARNEELNEKFQETVIGAKIAREMTVVLSRLNRLDNLIDEAKLRIESGEINEPDPEETPEEETAI